LCTEKYFRLSSDCVTFRIQSEINYIFYKIIFSLDTFKKEKGEKKLKENTSAGKRNRPFESDIAVGIAS